MIGDGPERFPVRLLDLVALDAGDGLGGKGSEVTAPKPAFCGRLRSVVDVLLNEPSGLN